jgi:hypothetical protein
LPLRSSRPAEHDVHQHNHRIDINQHNYHQHDYLDDLYLNPARLGVR